MENINNQEKLTLLKLRLDFFNMKFEQATSVMFEMAQEHDFEIGNLEGTYNWVLENINKESFQEEYLDFVERTMGFLFLK